MVTRWGHHERHRRGVHSRGRRDFWPSGSSLVSQRYGTELAARKSRTSKAWADQRWPTTCVRLTGSSSFACHSSISASMTG